MSYLLDTDTCIDVLRGQLGATQRLGRLARSHCAISSISVFELYCGLAKALRPENERDKIHRLVSEISAIQFDDTAAESAASIRAYLQRRGAVIGPYDLLIAGHAIATNRVLVTKNVREFQRVDGLRLESWA